MQPRRSCGVTHLMVADFTQTKRSCAFVVRMPFRRRFWSVGLGVAVRNREWRGRHVGLYMFLLASRKLIGQFCYELTIVCSVILDKLDVLPMSRNFMQKNRKTERTNLRVNTARQSINRPVSVLIRRASVGVVWARTLPRPLHTFPTDQNKMPAAPPPLFLYRPCY